MKLNPVKLCISLCFLALLNLFVLPSSPFFDAAAHPTNGTEQTTLLSINLSGNSAYGVSAEPDISADGRFVAFASTAPDLVSGDTNGSRDIFVHDRLTGVIERVSVNSSGSQANYHSWAPSISADGRFVAFHSGASNLVSGDTNNDHDVFVHDRQTGETMRVSLSSSGTQAEWDSEDPAISADGRYVAFESVSYNLIPDDTNDDYDIYRYDRLLGQVQRVSIATDGTQGNGNSYNPTISGDGRYVAFHTAATNFFSDDLNSSWEDILVHDCLTGETRRVSVASDGSQANGQSLNPDFSSDGRFVAFESHASNLAPEGPVNEWDIFVHDLQSGQTERVSNRPDGGYPDDDSYRASISGDGRFVAYHSFARDLVPGDTNSSYDVFLYDRLTHATRRVSVSTEGTQGNDDSQYPVLSSNGREVAFSSKASNLVPFDGNSEQDIFAHGFGSSTILVQDELGQPLGGAQVFINDALAGITSIDGVFRYFGLASGDTLVARRLMHEQPSLKDNHSWDSTQDWAYRIYTTSLDISPAGNLELFTVGDPLTTQTLTIKKSNTLVGFNLVVVVEWDANYNYLSMLRRAFWLASMYLYDTTDGQMLFEHVEIYDANNASGNEDVYIHTSNHVRANAAVSGIVDAPGRHVNLGRTWRGDWEFPDNYHVIIHEFGHYGLGLRDSYMTHDANGMAIEAHCTSADIEFNDTPDINATLMDYPYNTSEFSMRGVPSLWSSDCEATRQFQVHAASDWETIVSNFQDSLFPFDEWLLQTPLDHGGVVAGPQLFELPGLIVEAWAPEGNLHDQSDPQACIYGQNFWFFYLDNSNPAENVEVYMTDGYRLINQGKTNADGLLEILGAHNGDVIYVDEALYWTPTPIIVNCTTAESLQDGIALTSLALDEVSNQSTDVVFQQGPFGIYALVDPGAEARQFRVSAFLSDEFHNPPDLIGPPELFISQTGVPSGHMYTMEYDQVNRLYFAEGQLESGFPASGCLTIRAIDNQHNYVEVGDSFKLEWSDHTQEFTSLSTDGRATLNLPAGVLSADGQVSINPQEPEADPPEGLLLLGGPYRISASPGLVLEKPAGFSIYYDLEDELAHVDATTARLYRWDGAQWLLVESSSVPGRYFVSGTIDEFGVYAVLATQQEKLYLPVILR